MTSTSPPASDQHPPDPGAADGGGYRLPDGISVGPVHLLVTDLECSIAFYRRVLGLEPTLRSADHATLSSRDDTRPLIKLRSAAGVTPVDGPRWGLYHVAFLLPTRADLARFVRHAAAAGVPMGGADHLVSEAFYLHDPDGHGIEVYADRPHERWPWRANEVEMRSDPVDLDDLLASAGAAVWYGAPRGTVIGHVHLHVGDLERANAFYGDGLGFATTQSSYPGARFLAAGRYHHHLGVNTWLGPRARPAQPGEAALLEWELLLPGTPALTALTAHLDARGVAYQRETGSLIVADPWGTRVRVRAAASPAGGRGDSAARGAGA